MFAYSRRLSMEISIPLQPGAQRASLDDSSSPHRRKLEVSARVPHDGAIAECFVGKVRRLRAAAFTGRQGQPQNPCRSALFNAHLKRLFIKGQPGVASVVTGKHHHRLFAITEHAGRVVASQPTEVENVVRSCVAIQVHALHGVSVTRSAPHRATFISPARQSRCHRRRQSNGRRLSASRRDERQSQGHGARTHRQAGRNANAAALIWASNAFWPL